MGLVRRQGYDEAREEARDEDEDEAWFLGCCRFYCGCDTSLSCDIGGFLAEEVRARLRRGSGREFRYGG